MSIARPNSCPLAQNKLFAELEDALIAAALKGCSLAEYKAGSGKIFEEGSLGDCIYLIESGQVRISKAAPGGSEEMLAQLGPGDFFGEMALFGAHRRSASAAPETDCRLWRLAFADFDLLWRSDPGLSRNLLEHAHDRLSALDERYLNELIQRERLSIVGRMAASIVHDFRGPMTSIRGFAELIQLEHQEPDIIEHTQLIIREIDRLAGMAADMLDFCRSTVHLSTEPVDLGLFFADTVKLLRPTFGKCKIRLETNTTFNGTVPLDQQRFQRVMYNLALNAADAMPTGGTLRLTAARDGAFVRIEVSDTGCGIPLEHQQQIWQPFVSIGKKDGSGLGLPIARKLVECHGGSISLRSEVGRGTTISIRLPLKPPAQVTT